MVNSVLEHSIDNGHRTPNRVVLGTVLYAPKYTASTLPPWSNMTEKVREVNRWIGSFNEGATGLHLKIHQNGVYGDPDVGGSVEHKLEEWNEPYNRTKLHLNYHAKGRIAKQLVQVFEEIKKIR